MRLIPLELQQPNLTTDPGEYRESRERPNLMESYEPLHTLSHVHKFTVNHFFR